MALSREEMETVIRVGWGEEFATVSTTNPAHARQMQKGRRETKPAVVSKSDGDEVSWTFKVPADWFVLPRPPKVMSEGARVAAGERLRKVRGGDGGDDADE